MKFSRLKSRLKSFYLTFILPPKIWRRPKKSEILIYDACGAEHLAPYLVGYSVEIISLRRESVNVPILLMSILFLDFWKGEKQAYIDSFIRMVSPKLVITYIDNSIDFYTISKRFPNIRTMFVQNGSRGEIGDVFGHLVKSDDYKVDFMLVHGAAIGRYYRKFISGTTMVIGALKNNEIRKFTGVNDGSILFISQYFAKPKTCEPSWIETNGTPIYWNQFFKAEMQVLPFLDKWCSENHRLLRICGREYDPQGAENEFFSNYLTDCRWEYLPKSVKYSSYELVDTAEIVVFIDSTLGYESICRGNKTASFSCRGGSLMNESTKFGWPMGLPEFGPFWTNESSDIEISRIMDYLSTVGDEEWKQIHQKYLPELMEYDPGNSRFFKLMRELGVSLKLFSRIGD